MAIILPPDWPDTAYLHDGEKETIGWLADALTDDYVVWAGVEWASREQNGVLFVDASRAKQLPEIITGILDQKTPDPHKRERVLAFLDSQLSLALDIGTGLENQEKVYRTYGDRLAKFIDTLTFSPRRLHVQGAAGSGKTQLSASEAQRFVRSHICR